MSQQLKFLIDIISEISIAVLFLFFFFFICPLDLQIKIFLKREGGQPVTEITIISR